LSHRYCYLPLSWKSWNRFECVVGGVGHPQHTQTGILEYGEWMKRRDVISRRGGTSVSSIEFIQCLKKVRQSRCRWPAEIVGSNPTRGMIVSVF
jgi:hypothetical protein